MTEILDKVLKKYKAETILEEEKFKYGCTCDLFLR